jgi:hypothetical protein
MNLHRSAGILPLVFFLFSSLPGSGQPSAMERIQGPDSGDYFLYVDYCGSRYNSSLQRPELVIKAVKIPTRLLKKMPRMKSNGYSSRDCRIRMKQQEFIRNCGGETVVVTVNRKKFNAFYPKGLRKGIIIESGEFNQWNFREQGVPLPPPVKEQGKYNFYWYWHETDPVNINYGLTIKA